LKYQSGDLYAWGANDEGQTGCGKTEGNVLSPGKVRIPPNMGVGRIACGQSHVVALAYPKIESSNDNSSNVFTWGSHANGRLGVADTIGDVFVPRPADTRNLDIVDVAAGDAHSVALTMSGRVVAWGDNSKGQLGVTRKTEWTARPTTVRMADNEVVTLVEARGDANVALTEKGNVLQWGMYGY
jgi:alpha-tubulin suppressor-like RCC1 family protein